MSSHSPAPGPTPGGLPARSTAQTLPDIPGIQLGEVIGRGGFATVYGGIQESIQRPVAVKIDSRPLDQERNRRRYLREVQASGRIAAHPHVVSLVDTGVLRDGRPYIVMERCDGGSLETLGKNGALDPADAVRLVLAASSALGAAHTAGILHRDVKPANILLDSYGSPRLTDFGIAAVVREDQDPTVTLECLTPDFAPPEAFEMAPPAPAGDVWSMGAVLYFLLTGRGPRRGPDGRALSLPEIVRCLDEPVTLTDPAIPQTLRPLLSRALARAPQQRFPDGSALAAALAEAEQHLGKGGLTVTGPDVAVRLAQASSHQGEPYPASAQAPVGRQPHRHRTLLAASAAGLAAGVLLGGGSAAALMPRATRAPQATSAAPVPTTGVTSTADAAGASAPASEGASAQAGNQPVTGPEAGSAPPYPQGACLGGLTTISGVRTSRQVDCSQEHSWEVFATGALSDQTTGFTVDELKADPTVQATCTPDKAVAYGEPDPMLAVIGPTEVQWTVNGARGFSCLVTPANGESLVGSYTER